MGCACCCALPETEQGLALLAGCRGHGFTFLRDGVQRVRWRWAGVVLPCEAALGPPCKAVVRLMLPLSQAALRGAPAWSGATSRAGRCSRHHRTLRQCRGSLSLLGWPGLGLRGHGLG